MSYLKHRAWPGVLALVCLLVGLLAASPLPATNGHVYASTGPDLIIESVSWSPESPSLGNTVTFTTAIKNQGDSQAAVSRLAYYIDDSLISTAYINAIAAGDTAINTFTWQATAGDHVIKVISDNDNVVAEANEENNAKICAFSVLAADFIIESITWTPETVSFGDTVTFTVTVKNRGSKAGGPCWMEFFIDGSSRGQRDGGRLEPRETKTFEYIWIAQAGEHTLKAIADVLDYTTESDETNNDLSAIYTTKSPDLAVLSISWSPPDRTDTDYVTMHVTVKNKGSGKAVGSWLDFNIDGITQSSVYLDTLNAGAIATRTYTWMPTTAEHELTAVIDSKNWIYESNESNNTYSATLPAVTPADLLVQSITWTPQNPTINSRMTYTVTITNAGNRAVFECYVDLYVEYGYKIKRKLGPIPAGGTASASMEYITDTVPIQVRAIVDPDNYVTESDETNNELVASLTPSIPTQLDFYVKSLTCTPENPAVGDTVTITAKIKNNSSYVAGVSHLAYYVDDVLIETVPISRISIKGTITNTITWTATTGTHIIKVVADYNDYHNETNENNNVKELTITTLSPDLAIESISWLPEIPVKGDALSITFTVINQGSYTSQGCYIDYYIDGSHLGNHLIEEIAPGGTVTRTIPWTLANDYLTFKVIIDQENTITEDNEANNEKTVSIPAPDLTIESISSSPDEFSENETVTFVIKIGNTGRTMSEPTYIDCYINNVLQTSLPVGPIAAGSFAEVSFDWTAMAGQNTIKVLIDETDAIVEFDETNNENSLYIETTAAATASTPTELDATTTDNTTSNETQEATPGATSDDDLSPPASDSNVPAANVLDEISEQFGDDSPLWQDILGNRWTIIGVAVLGGAAILVLLMLRKRSQAV